MLQNQRGVGGGVLRLKLRQLHEVAGIGHHSGELLEGVELVHRVCAQRGVAADSAWVAGKFQGPKPVFLKFGLNYR